MTIRTILVPIRGDGTGEQVLDHAYALGAPFNAHITVVHSRPRPEDLIPFGVAVPKAWRDQITSSATGIADTEETQLRDLFNNYISSHSIDLCDTRPAPHDRLTISWSEATGKQANIIGVRGRLSDVVAVPKPDRDRNLGQNTLESALMESGRPVLLCPAMPVTTIGKRVAIAWNGSAESSRAVSLSMPILQKAEAVTVMTSMRDSDLELKGTDLCFFLKDHGVDAEVVAINAGPSNIGRRLLGTAADNGADVMVMGAYGRSRGREMILGGATQSVIDKTHMPVLMVH